ncbi:MAG: phosphatidylglycerophosphatase A [Chromatocurvus sp.]
MTTGHSSAVPRPFRSPVQFFAFGFGIGLSRWAPGTLGTLVAVPLYLSFAHTSLWLYSAIVLVAVVFGVWICDRASEELGVHDHSGIVWDEFVGLWIALWAVPVEPVWIVLGFIVFRILDIAKPWPIGLLDRHVEGGLGIMIDDIVAGVFSCAILHAGVLLARETGALT